MVDPRSDLVPFLEDLLSRWASGELDGDEVMRVARARWEPVAWPEYPGDDPRGVAPTVLWLLAFARQMGLLVEDVPSLQLAVRDPGGGIWPALEPMIELMDLEVRERLVAERYGPELPDDIDEAEMSYSNPNQRRLHRGVREDPEAVWPEVKARICDEPDLFAEDLVSDLVDYHAAAFVDRLMSLADECPGARRMIANLYTGDWPATPEADRFVAFVEGLQASDAGGG